MMSKLISQEHNMGIQAGAATLENSMEVPQETKNRTTLQPSNCTSRHLSTGYRCAISKGHMHPHVYSSTIGNNQRMERAQTSNCGWMDKEDVVYVHMCVCVCVCVCVIVCVYIYICCVYIYMVCTCTNIYIYTYIYIHTHTHTHIYIQWSITRPSKRMKSCHLQLHGWNWRVLMQAKLEKDKYRRTSLIWGL